MHFANIEILRVNLAIHEHEKNLSPRKFYHCDYILQRCSQLRELHFFNFENLISFFELELTSWINFELISFYISYKIWKNYQIQSYIKLFSSSTQVYTNIIYVFYKLIRDITQNHPENKMRPSKIEIQLKLFYWKFPQVTISGESPSSHIQYCSFLYWVTNHLKIIGNICTVDCHDSHFHFSLWFLIDLPAEDREGNARLGGANEHHFNLSAASPDIP